MKGVKLCLSLLALFAVSSIASLALYSTDANAQSDVDNVIQVKETLEIRGGSRWYNNCSTDVTENWSAYIHDRSKWRYSTEQENFTLEVIRTSYLETITSPNGKWGVIKPENVNGNVDPFGETMRIWWTQDPVTVEFFDYTSTVKGLSVSPVNYVDVGVYDYSGTECLLSITNNEWQNNQAVMIASDEYLSNRYYSLFATNITISYPAGYAGEYLPDVPPGATSNDNSTQPRVKMTSVQSFKAVFSDENFFTFDGNPFLCGEFAPSLSVEIWNNPLEPDETLLTSFTNTASAQFNYTFPTSQRNEAYRIVAWYSCPEYNFTASQFYDFEIDARGNLVGATPCSAELFCSLNFPTYGLTEVVLAPLAFLAEIPTMTCTSLALPMPNGISNLSLPCMTPIYQQHFGGILLLFQTIITGLFAYYVSLRIFGNIKELANPRDDQVETVRL